MKILFVSKDAAAADIAFRMALDGHKVQLYIDDPKDRDIFDGIVPKCVDWTQGVKNTDLVVFDDNKCSHIWRAIHKDINCFGGSPFSARLENDRGFAHALMEKAGIPQVESLTFKKWSEVISHLKEDRKAHVIKPQGNKVKSHHLIVGEDEDNSDAISQIERLMSIGLPVDAIEVEERKRGVEIGLSMWFNGMEPIGPIEINFEHKRSHEGERGYLTGETGTLMRYIEDPDLPLYRDTLARIIPALRAADFRGQIDLNMIVGRDPKTGERFIAPLEFTPRLGKPAIFITDELHVTPWADLFMGCASGKKAELRVRYDWAVGVLLSSFGFPFEDQATEISSGLEIRGLDEHSLEHIHPMEVRLDRKGKFIVSSGEGYILVATGRGGRIHEAKESAYSNLACVRLANSYFRRDITDKIQSYELDDLGILPVEEHIA